VQAYTGEVRNLRAGKGFSEKAKFTAGDLLRIPVGLLFMFWSVVAVFKAFTGLSLEPLRIVILLMALGVAAIFLPLGFAMAFGWLSGGQRPDEDVPAEE
jgi:uncharacterized membrane protein YbaN (DUF454 family)